MLVRYSGSAGGGFLVTGALLFWMQHIIAAAEFPLRPQRQFDLMPLPRIEEPPHPTVRTPPPPPTPRTPAPEITITTVGPTAGDPGQGNPVTPPGPPRPPTGLTDRTGPWLGDSDLLLLARITPIYPHTAIRNGIEGYVVVEFTVTRNGDVGDIQVVESSNRIFESAAITAVAKSRYQPRIVGGVAIEVEGVRTQLEFELED